MNFRPPESHSFLMTVKDIPLEGEEWPLNDCIYYLFIPTAFVSRARSLKTLQAHCAAAIEQMPVLGSCFNPKDILMDFPAKK